MTLRQRIVYGFSSLLFLMLAVGGLSLWELRRHSQALQREFTTSRDSVNTAVNVTSEIGLIARQCILDSPKPPAERSDIMPAIAAVDQNIDRLVQPHEGGDLPRHGTDIEALWAEFRDTTIWFQGGEGSGPDRLTVYMQELPPRLDVLRDALRQIIVWHLNNMSAMTDRAQQQTGRVQMALVSLLVLGALIAGGLMTWLGSTIIRRTNQLLGALDQVSRRDLDVELPRRKRDEFGQLGAAIEQMAGKLREYEQTDKAAIARSQSVARVAVDSLRAAVCMVSCDGLIEVANRSAERLFNLREGTNLRDTGWNRIIELVDRACETAQAVIGSGYESAITIMADDNEAVYIPSVVPILEEGGAVTGATIILDDVTMLRRLDEMKTGMVSTVSHELKTPLTSIRMAVYLLLGGKAGPLTPMQRETLDTAREESERLLATINELLDLSRIEGGRLVLEREEVPIGSLVEETLGPLRSRFAEAGMNIATDIPSTLPAVSVDRSRMTMVLSNLMTNALKYCHRGDTVTIRAGLSNGGQPELELVVEDTGPGMAEDQCEFIFERFYRVDGGKGRGTGLGLHIARELTRAHGGDIQCTSRVGEGSTFRVTLPVGGPAGDRFE